MAKAWGEGKMGGGGGYGALVTLQLSLRGLPSPTEYVIYTENPSRPHRGIFEKKSLTTKKTKKKYADHSLLSLIGDWSFGRALSLSHRTQAKDLLFRIA